METTGKALVDHLERLNKRGDMKSNTARTLLAAVRTVLSVEEGWEDLDVTQIDVEDMFRRFVNVKGNDFKSGSLAAYQRRFRQAVTDFKKYVADPVNFKPSMRTRTVTPKDKTTSGNGNGGEDAAVAPSKPSVAASVESGLVNHPFPLRDGRIARLQLPPDLQLKDVHRMYAFLKSLATDFEAPEA